jgi:hypothetical protein
MCVLTERHRLVVDSILLVTGGRVGQVETVACDLARWLLCITAAAAASALHCV